MVGFFRSLRELAPPDVDLGELGALLDPLPEVVPGSTTNSSGVNSINKSASMSSTKSDDSNNSDGQQQQGGTKFNTKKILEFWLDKWFEFWLEI